MSKPMTSGLCAPPLAPESWMDQLIANYIFPLALRRSSSDIWFHNICRFSSTHWLPGEESSARDIH